MVEEIPLSSSKSGYTLVQDNLFCVTTRIELKHFWQLPRMMLHYFRVRHKAKHISGLKRQVVLLENIRTLFVLSIWENEDAFVDFLTHTPAHLDAVRQSMRHATRTHNPSGVGVWSVEWQIRARGYNLNWGATDDWTQLRAAPTKDRRTL